MPAYEWPENVAELAAAAVATTVNPVTISATPTGESYLHAQHWEPLGGEVAITVAGQPGEQNLGSAVPAGQTRRIREITVRHSGTNNTVITLISPLGTKVTFDVAAQTTRVWSSQDGRFFVAGEQAIIRSSDITGGSTYVSAVGIQG